MARLSIAIAFTVLSALASVATTQQIGGAAVANDYVTQLIKDFNKGSNVKLPNYDSTSAGTGIAKYIDGSYAVGVTGTTLSSAQEASLAAKGRKTATIPFALQTFSFITKNGGLSLGACQIAKIYTGKITKWQQISGSGRSGTIIPVQRDAGSGLTEAVTEYLRKGCPSEWPNKFVGIGPYKTGNPNLVFKSGTGMSSFPAGNANALSYALTGFATTEYRLKEVAIENQAGKRVTSGSTDPYLSIPRPLPDTFASWSAVSLTWRAGAKTYPISGFTYFLARSSYKGIKNGAVVKKFLLYAVGSKGQALATKFYFLPIPSSLATTIKAGINKIIV